MARPKSQMPALQHHISGNAVCKIDGTTYYLGKYGSAESLARYAVLIREYQVNGLRVPDSIDLDSMIQVPPEQHVENQVSDPITVKHVATVYHEHAKAIYAEGSKDLARIKKLTDELIEHYGEVLADEFGPRALKEQRKRWIDAGNSRKYCNRLTNGVIRMYKHAVAEELVDQSAWQRLRSLEPLRAGQTTAREIEPIQPADIAQVRATAAFLSPVLKAMLRIHIATGMRPSELCRMRPMDIDRTGDVWMYRPPKHKTASRGKARAIPIVGDAQDALVDYLNRKPSSCCFSPAESMSWFRAKQRSERKGYGSYKKRKSNPVKQPGDCYDSHSYRRAIQNAAAAAKVAKWHPYQLRHLAGTIVRDALGPEAAQALLGHANIQMTEHYAKVTERKAIEAARHAPKL
jgi:integrase